MRSKEQVWEITVVGCEVVSALVELKDDSTNPCLQSRVRDCEVVEHNKE